MVFAWIKRLLAAVLILFVAFHVLVAAMLAIWSSVPVTGTTFMLTQRLSGGQVRQIWVNDDQIAKTIKQAVIASEDANFTTHHGFDFASIEAAMKANEAAGAVTLGGSTISQQLAKNLFLTAHRSYLRKGEEAIITVMIEQFWSKSRILEVYLNVVEFADGVYGIEAASRHYFGKSAHQLNREQAALLASLLPNPKFYEKNINNRHLRAKQRIILKRMKTAKLPENEKVKS